MQRDHILALKRAPGEGVQISFGDNAPFAAVRVVSIEQGEVRLAFQAPRAVRVLRDELVPADRRLACTPGAGRAA